MKTIIAVIVTTSCFLAVASAQSAANCARRATQIANCQSRLASVTDEEAFCRECGNAVVSYFQDCTGGVGVDQVDQICSVYKLNGDNNIISYDII